MDKLFESLKGVLKFQGVVIDNHVFRLHYKVTLPILVAFSLLVTSRQYIGDPISCISKDDIPTRVLDTFCWIHSTFSLENAWFKKVGLEVPYPGIDKYTNGEKRIYHAYYQWVCFVLFLQALLFYLPRYFWKCMESGKIKAMILELNNPVLNEAKRETNLRLLVDYVMANFNHNDSYCGYYLMAEVMNAVNVIGQMYLMDTFLGGAFSSYGTQVWKFSDWDWSLRYDPMIRVFPRLTKCTFHRYGSSGDVQRHDAMCILPINIINEKIYVFLWFWFVGLSVVSCIAVAYRILLYVSPDARMRSLKPRANLAREEHIEIVLNKCKAGDWFVVHLLAKNLHSVNFRDFMSNLSRQLEGKNYSDSSDA
ncbi:innexin inx2 [Trichonephila clavipes]|nr:innexin inx2 [Trichonephila clavipes]